MKSAHRVEMVSTVVASTKVFTELHDAKDAKSVEKVKMTISMLLMF